MKVAILGSGAIGLASATLLAANGHTSCLWSPSGAGTAPLGLVATVTTTGAHAGAFQVTTARRIEVALEGAEAVLVAVDAGGHTAVMEAAAPFLEPGQTVIVGAAHAMGAVYLSALLAARGVCLPVVSWNTAAATAHKTGPASVDIRTVRPRIEASVMPAALAEHGLATCRTLLPAQFEARLDALAIALLSNSNPVFHVPVCLFNITRIAKGETWAPYAQTTPEVGALMEALDAERLAIAATYGHSIHSVNAHFHRSFRIPEAPMSEMCATLAASGRGPKGPTRIGHRYFTQDIPYGLAFAETLAQRAGIAAPVHRAMIDLADIALGRDHRAANALSARMGLSVLDPAQILILARDGHFGAPDAAATKTMRTA